MLAASLWIFSQFLSATISPPVDLVSAPSTTPSLKTTPQIVVPVLVIFGGLKPLDPKKALLEKKGGQFWVSTGHTNLSPSTVLKGESFDRIIVQLDGGHDHDQGRMQEPPIKMNSKFFTAAAAVTLLCLLPAVALPAKLILNSPNVTTSPFRLLV